MAFRYLNRTDMGMSVTMPEVIDEVQKALIISSSSEAVVPLRTNIPVEANNGNVLFMPAYATKTGEAGCKVVSVYPDNVKIGKPATPSTMILINSKTGEMLGLMDGTFLTQLRTGAISGLATRLLSREDSHIFALIGCGGQALTQLEAVLCVRPIEEVRLYDYFYDRACSFANEMAKKYPKISFKACKTPDEAVTGADVITTVTTAKSPTFAASNVKKGAHINAIGSYKPDMQELPEEVVASAYVCADSISAVIAESGDIIIPLQKHLITPEHISAELGEIAMGRKRGRVNPDEITLMKSVGVGIIDAVVGQAIFDHAVEKGLGTVFG